MQSKKNKRKKERKIRKKPKVQKERMKRNRKRSFLISFKVVITTNTKLLLTLWLQKTYSFFYNLSFLNLQNQKS